MAFCFGCKNKISASAPKVFVDGQWWCANCLYYKDRGEINPVAKS